MDLAFGPALRAHMTAAFEGFERRSVDDAHLQRAAVAMVIVPNARGEACFVLTRRPHTLSRHAGQFALPGGRLDAAESAIEAALRETHEEVGARLEHGRVIGTLDDFPTRSGFRITPIVVWGGRTPLVANPQEVAAIHRVPLAALLAPGVVHLDTIDESTRPVLSLSMLDNRVYAPTAAMLFQLREVVLLGRLTRVDEYEQPLFAWR